MVLLIAVPYEKWTGNYIYSMIILIFAHLKSVHVKVYIWVLSFPIWANRIQILQLNRIIAFNASVCNLIDTNVIYTGMMMAIITSCNFPPKWKSYRSHRSHTWITNARNISQEFCVMEKMQYIRQYNMCRCWYCFIYQLTVGHIVSRYNLFHLFCEIVHN